MAARSRGAASALLVLAVLAPGFFAVAPSSQAAVPDLQEGDLLVGTAIAENPFGEIVGGAIKRIRGGAVETYCEGPRTDREAGYFSIPRDIIVDSDGRVVFWAGGGDLWRCDGAGPALVWVAGVPVEGFEGAHGFHLARLPRVELSDQGLPVATVEDAYVLVVASLDGQGGRKAVETWAYVPSRGTWQRGAEAPQQTATSRYADIPDLVSDGRFSYGVVDGTLRRVSEPIRIATPTGELAAFGGSGEVSYAFTDDIEIPNVPSGCPPVPGVSSEMPSVNGGFGVVSRLREVIVDHAGGLGVVLQSHSLATGTPYLTQTSQVLVDDDARNDLSAHFTHPGLECAVVPSLHYRSIVGFTDDAGKQTLTDRFVGTASGLAGTRRFDGQVIRVVPHGSVQVLATGLLQPIGLAAYPHGVPSPTGGVLLVQVSGCADAVLEDPAGRRLGGDASGEGGGVNDFGPDGYRGVDAEGRVYAIRDPRPGAYVLTAGGPGCSGYEITVQHADFAQPQGSRLDMVNDVPPDGSRVHRFRLDEQLASGDTQAPLTTLELEGEEGSDGWWRSEPRAILHAADDDSGVEATLLGLDEEPLQPASAASVAGEGAHVVRFGARDRAGNVEGTHAEAVRVDTVPPTTRADLGGTPGDAGWWRSHVTVNLACVDATSGCARTRFALDDGETRAYEGPFVVSGDGVHEFMAWSEDAAGNAEEPRSFAVPIDATAPDITFVDPAEGTLSINDAQFPRAVLESCRIGLPAEVCAELPEHPLPLTIVLGTTTLRADAQDGLSGMGRVEFAADGAIVGVDDDAPFTAMWAAGDEALGEHALVARAFDRAGNAGVVTRFVRSVPTSLEGVEDTVGGLG